MHKPINPVLQQSRDARSRYLLFGESEHFFAEVFQGGTDVIDVRPVDNQEAVVALLVGVDAYRGMLPLLTGRAATGIALSAALSPSATALR